MDVIIKVSLFRLEDGSTTVKTVVDLKDLRLKVSKEQFADIVDFMTTRQKAILDKFNGGREVYSPYKLINDSTLVMPRFMFQRISKYLTDLEISHEVVHRSHISMASQLRNFGCKYGKLKMDIFPDKLRVIDKITDQLKTCHGMIVKLDTGKGKSVIICEVTRRLDMKTLWLVKDKTLQQQLHNDVHATMHLDDNEDCCDCLTKTGANHCPYVAFLGGVKSRHNTELLESGNYKILIAVINSARSKPSSFWKPFGITFLDECPAYTSEKFSEIFENCQTHYMVGLSATPDDKWNSVMLEHNIGNIIDFDDDIKLNGVIRGKVYKIVYNGPPQYTRRITNSKGVVSVAKMVEQFMGDPDRNSLIINTTINAVTKHKYGFVFAMRNDFLRLLKELFDKECKSRNLNIESVVLCADSTSEERLAAYKSANVIFTNYAFGTGLNIVHTRFEVHASPYRNGGKQITGRILRKDLTDERFFYDIVDNKTQLRDQFNSRMEIYTARGLTVEEVASDQLKLWF